MCEKRLRLFFGVLAVLLGAGAVLAFSAAFAPVGNFIIAAGERYVGRPLNHPVWTERLFKFGILIGCILLAYHLLAVFAALGKYPKLKKSSGDGLLLHGGSSDCILFLLLFASLIAVRIFYISQKKSLHLDEVYSIAISNINKYGFWDDSEPFETGRLYKGREIKSLSLWDDGSVRDSLSDIMRLYVDNKDSSHTSFYYIMLRLWFTGVKSSDLSSIIWRGCTLNLLLFTVSFIFLLLLFFRFTKNRFTVFVCLALAFLSPDSLSSTVFLRDYELQQMFIILLSYYITCLLQAENNGANVATTRNFCAGILLLSFTMLSHYFTLIFIGLLGFSLLLTFIKEKKYNLVSFFIYMFALSLLLSKVLYLNFGMGFLGGRGEEAFSMLGENARKNLGIWVNALRTLATRGNLPFTLFVLAGVVYSMFLFAVNMKKDFVRSLLFAVDVVFLLLVLYFAPLSLKQPRYIAPGIPLLFVIFTADFPRKIHIPYLVSLLALTIMSLLPLKRQTAVVEHLDDGRIKDFAKLSELPTVYLKYDSPYTEAVLLPYLGDENDYCFVNSIADMDDGGTQDFYCIVPSGEKPADVKEACLISNLGYISDVNRFCYSLYQVKFR